jgi:hypothetical protein
MKGLRELKDTKLIYELLSDCDDCVDLLPCMYSLQTFRYLVSYTYPTEIQTRHAALLDLRLVIPPVKSKRNVEQCARKGHQFVQSQRRPGVGEKFVITHRQERLSVKLGEE